MKFIKQIMYQRKLVEKFNDSEELIELVPEDRVIVRYVEGEESELIIGDALKETPDVEEPSILIKKSDMSSGNPDGVDLSNVGSQELLEQLLINLKNKINE